MTPATTDKKLTFKQRKWLKVYLQTGSATDAAMQAYDCKSRETAANIGYENLRKLDYQELLETAGVSDQTLIATLIDGLQSTKLATSFTEADQLIPDYQVRHKYLETGLKLKKRLGPESLTVQQFNTENMTLELTNE